MALLDQNDGCVQAPLCWVSPQVLPAPGHSLLLLLTCFFPKPQEDLDHRESLGWDRRRDPRLGHLLPNPCGQVASKPCVHMPGREHSSSELRCPHPVNIAITGLHASNINSDEALACARN